MQYLFNAIDAALFYDLPFNEIYLILNNDNEVQENIKHIRIATKRFLDLDYRKDEPVRMLIKNQDTKKFDIIEIPSKNGVYDMYSVLAAKGICPGLAFGRGWGLFKKEVYEHIHTIIISDYAMLTGLSDYAGMYNITFNQPTEIKDTKIHLHSANFQKMYHWEDYDLLNKGLYGKTIKVQDFFKIVDDERNNMFQLDFGSFRFNKLRNKIIIVEKKLDEKYIDSENITFHLDESRIVIPSMFLKFVLQAESKKQLVNSINEYYVGNI